MPVQWKSIQQNKPAIFDWLVFTISLLLGFIFPTLTDFATSPSFSKWMLAGTVLYTVGLLLKHHPLYYRLSLSGKQPRKFSYTLVLIIGHWVIMLALVIFSEDAFRSISGMVPLPKDSAPTGIRTFTAICTAAVLTWLAFRPWNNNRKVLSAANLFRRELAADILLIAGVSILTFVFWEKSMLPVSAKMPLDSIGNIWLLFLFLCFTYMLIYLPLRYLYLIEDHSGKQAWKRLILIFILILVRELIKALRF